MRRNLLGGDDQFKRILKENRVVQRAAPLGRTSVNNGYTEFNGNESIVVNGSQKVTGWLIVTGTLKVVGAFLLEGVTTITGALTVAGSWALNGAGTIAGNVTQTGIFTMNAGGRLDVLGSIAMAIGQISGGRAGIQFASGVLSGQSDRITMENGSALIGAAAGSAVMLFGTNGILANATGVNLSIPTATTAVAANLVRNASGYLQLSSSSERYKLAIEAMDVPDSLLDDVPMKSWFDKGDSERLAAMVGQPRPYTREQQEALDATSLMRRTPGVIAEEVHAAGGEAFVTFDDDGEISGVAKDLLALAQVAVLNRRVNSQAAELAELRELVSNLCAS